MKIRIKDIAEKAGTSVGTVDRVIHNRGEVREEIRQKVLDIIKELNYKPNLLAKTLASKKTIRIAVLIPENDENNPYWEKPMQGILNASEELKDFNTHIEIVLFNADNELSYEEGTKKILASKPDGVLLIPVFKVASIAFVKHLDELSIPYVFFDVNIDNQNSLAFFGQDAWMSGYVSAKLMHVGMPENSAILVLNIANNKVIAHNIRKREQGFMKFFEEDCTKKIALKSCEVDLLYPNELELFVSNFNNEHRGIKGIFVTGSRVYKVAQIIEKLGLSNMFLMGYDLIEPNVAYLNKGVINYLISQNPELQGYNGVVSLFRHLVYNIDSEKINYSPINIIIKENLPYI